ncbi:oligopeptide ABC transporter permease [Alkalihalobacillus sp. TS-13]|uniref:oligopeptide ABC transporter permease n=1 Tax=Alkalihalobacillus sp. TS-13 TaxID=2842455 RepID=UPI001C86EB0F|nr:oligopeptide ABC transporter permease [Alkalihalobacillus sp. TS-13]
MSQPEKQLRPGVPVHPEPLPPDPLPKPETLTRITVEKFTKNKLAVIGLITLVVIILAAIFAPYLTPYEPSKQELLKRLTPPNGEHWLGVDTLGRDMLTRMLYGARVSLLVGFASVAVSIVIGTIIGSIAGYYGGLVDAFLMRVVDVFLSIPSLFFLITVVTIFEPSLSMLILAFALFGWTTTARLVRGEFLTLRSREFVLAAKTMGVRSSKIIFSHILPNAMGPVIVTATLNIGIIILAESALSYLGLGVQPPTPSWGNMLQDAQNLTIMYTAPWYPIFPGVMILITVLAFNFVGDGLRDAFDPKMKS